jgi:hypothetical protein
MATKGISVILRAVLAAGLALFFTVACKGTGGEFTDIGQGFESNSLHAPWSGLDNDTHFCCHSTDDRFFFQFEAVDSTLMVADPFASERDVDSGDRVEIFFASDPELKSPYYCAEIDECGRVMDYKAEFYRKFDFEWNFDTIETFAEITNWGYRVAGSISREELNKLGMDLGGGFWFGVFQGDTGHAGGFTWYSLVPTDDDKPDFHKSDVFFPCKMNPKKEKRGVVVYPDDITSIGINKWEKRIDVSGINLIGLHAATSNDPIDTLEAFIKSREGRSFLELCKRKGVEVEYELHAAATLLPRSLYDAHPEYFRQDESGRRVADYNFCFTSEAALEAMRPQLEKLLEWMKPDSHRYFLWPDDKEWKYCNCERCKSLSPSEQTLVFENRLLGMLREYDLEATLAHLAYHQTLPAPRKVRAVKGVFLEYAPIMRDYSEPLPETEYTALKDNLLAFPAYSQHILEYWLDESMNSGWKKTMLKPLAFNGQWCRRDIAMYRGTGAASITNFATWLNASYESLYGSALPLFESYGRAAGRLE